MTGQQSPLTAKKELEERSAAVLTARALSGELGRDLEFISKPDQDERTLPSVDFLFSDGEQYYAIEHTRVEGFRGQLHYESVYAKKLTPLAHELTPIVSQDELVLVTIDKDFVCDELSRSDLEGQVGAVIRAELKNVPPVDPDRRSGFPSFVQIPKTQSQIRIQRVCADLYGTSGVEFNGSVGDNRDEVLPRHIVDAIRKKKPKLEAEKCSGRTTVLVLEQSDISLTSWHSIFDALCTDEAMELLTTVDWVSIVVQRTKSRSRVYIVKDPSGIRSIRHIFDSEVDDG